jgi:uncharacterized lipoprotein YmbA
VASLPGLSLGLGPIRVPDTLERPQILIRQAPYRVELAEFHRWAGDLRASLGRLLAERLMASLGTERVALHPWARHLNPDYQAQVEVLRFDGGLGGNARLTGNWTLLDSVGQRELHREAFDLQQPVAGVTHGDLVRAMSRLAAALADRMAAGIAARTAARG